MTIDLKAIRAAAEAATPGPWRFGTFHKLLITDADNSKHFPIAQIEGSELPWDSTEESKRAYNNADHIATANPATILALLDKLEAAEKDAARLDYIESNCEGKLLRKYKKKWSFMPVCCNYEYPVFPNLRDALDYSMKDEQK